MRNAETHRPCPLLGIEAAVSDQSPIPIPIPIPIPSPGRVRAGAQRCASSRHVGAEAADDDQAVVLRIQSGTSGCGLVEGDARGGGHPAEKQEVVWSRIDSVDMFEEARILASVWIGGEVERVNARLFRLICDRLLEKVKVTDRCALLLTCSGSANLFFGGVLAEKDMTVSLVRSFSFYLFFFFLLLSFHDDGWGGGSALARGREKTTQRRHLNVGKGEQVPWQSIRIVGSVVRHGEGDLRMAREGIGRSRSVKIPLCSCCLERGSRLARDCDWEGVNTRGLRKSRYWAADEEPGWPAAPARACPGTHPGPPTPYYNVHNV